MIFQTIEPPLSFSELFDLIYPFHNRFSLVFPKAHPVPIDGRIGIVDDWYPEDRVAFEFGDFGFCGCVFFVGHWRIVFL